MKTKLNPIHSTGLFRVTPSGGGAWVFTDVGATTEFGELGRNISTAHALLNSRGGSRARMLIQEEKLR